MLIVQTSDNLARASAQEQDQQKSYCRCCQADMQATMQMTNENTWLPGVYPHPKQAGTRDRQGVKDQPGLRQKFIWSASEISKVCACMHAGFVESGSPYAAAGAVLCRVSRGDDISGGRRNGPAHRGRHPSLQHVRTPFWTLFFAARPRCFTLPQ